MQLTPKLLATCALCILSSTTFADFTAGVLRDYCTNKADNFSTMMSCVSYIAGFRAGHVVGQLDAVNRLGVLPKKDNGQEAFDRKFSMYCAPPKSGNGQIIEVFVKYMNDHPEQLHQPPELVLSNALNYYFPCKAK